MDGASKFVRGDAVAGLLVLFINIIGGLAIGMSQHSLSFGVAAEQYTLLTVGDGLVAQIPALVLSTATAIIVTRAAHSQQMGEAVVEQLFGSPAALGISGGVMALLGLVPGMPNLAFLTLGAIGGGAAFLITQKRRGAQDTVSAPAPVEPAPEARDLSWDDVTPVDLIGLEVGYRLIPLVDRNQGGALMSRIKGVRKKLSQELGFLIQPIHIRDNLELAPNAYRITLLGVPVGEAEIHPERELAINPGRVFGVVPGIAAKDPAFNLDALWIESAQREQAQTLGYTVVDAATVVATHLSQLLQNHAHELLGHEEAQQLLDVLGRSVPKLVEDLVPKQLSLACVLKVLQNLLEEHIPVRDLRSIAETLAEHAARSQDPATLTAAVRVALGRLIVQNINGMAQELPVITLDPQLEQLLHQAVTGNGAGGFEPGLAERLHASLAKSAEAQELKGQPAVLLVGQALRPWLARLTRHSIQNLRVLAYEEVPDSRQVKVVASVGQ